MFLVSLVIAVHASAAVFIFEGHEGEGALRVVTAVERIDLREGPSVAAKIVRTMTVPRNTKLEVTGERTFVLKEGVVEFVQNISLEGDDFGAIQRMLRADFDKGLLAQRRTVSFKKGQRLPFVLLRSEGNFVGRHGGNLTVFDFSTVKGDEPVRFYEDVYKYIERPQTSLWVRILGPGAESGWVEYDGNLKRDLRY